MDNLAHTLIGVAVSRAGLAQRFGAGTTLTIALASNLPDLDALYAWWDPMDRFLLRRTHTHALVAWPLLAALLATALHWRLRERPWPVLFGLSLLGIGLHVLFDLVNAFGVVVLWPFSPHRFELASIFILDLFIWGVTLAPLLASRFLSDRHRRRANQAAVLLLGFYVLVTVGAHERAEQLARKQHPRAEVLKVFPEPLGPHRFRAVARFGDAWHVSMVHLLGSTVDARGVVRTDEAAPRVAELKASPTGRRLERFMAAPVWTVHPDGRAEVLDLRFHSLVVERQGTFTVVFPPGRSEPEWK